MPVHVQLVWDLLKMTRREATVCYLSLSAQSLQSQQFEHLVKSMAPKDSFLRPKECMWENWQFLEYRANCILSNPQSMSNPQCMENGGKGVEFSPVCFPVFFTSSLHLVKNFCSSVDRLLEGQHDIRLFTYSSFREPWNSWGQKAPLEVILSTLLHTGSAGSTTQRDLLWWYAGPF